MTQDNVGKELMRQKISAASTRFTASDRVIAEYLLRSYPRSLLQSASAIAKELALNVSTVIRFFPKIGYKDLREAQHDFKDEVLFLINSPLDRLHENKSLNNGMLLHQKAIELEFQNLEKTFSHIQADDIAQFQNLVTPATTKIIVWGIRKEYALAYYLYIQLNTLREEVHLLQPQLMIETLAHIRADSLLLLFDFRRYPKINQLVAQHVKNRGGKIILFTDSLLSPCAQYADHCFVTETQGSSAFDSYTAAMSLINILLTELIKSTESTFLERQKDKENLGEFLDLYEWQVTKKLS